MPRTFRPINVPPNAPPELKALVTDLNRIHADIAAELAKAQGLDGRTPEFHNDPTMHGHRLTDTGVATGMDDVLTCRALDQLYGLEFPVKPEYAAARHSLRIKTTIHAAQGMTVPYATEKFAAIPLCQAEDVTQNYALAQGYVDAADVQALIDAVLPVGSIIGWTGLLASCPAHFAVCNGVDNAPGPDLTAEFVV